MTVRLPVALLLALLLLPAVSRAEWSTDGIPQSVAPRAQYGPVLVPGDSGTALAAWLDFRSGYNVDVYAQRMQPDGRLAQGWLALGDTVTYITCVKHHLAAAPDGAGGAYLVWSDIRCRDTTGIDIFVQRVVPSGAAAPGWPRNGLLLCGRARDQVKPAITADGSGGAVVAWVHQEKTTSDIYAARVLSSGVLAPGWPEGGTCIATAIGDTAGPVICLDGAGGAFVAWHGKRSATRDIYAQHVRGDGSIEPGWPAADGLLLSGAQGDQVDPLLASDGEGGAYVVWSDLRSGASAVYGQHLVGPSGEREWLTDGLGISSGPGERRARALVSDGAGGLIAAWEDGREPGHGMDIRVARLDGSGFPAPGWPGDGAPACSAPGNQTAPALAADSAGGVFVAWADARDSAASGLDVFATHLGGAGAPAAGWAPEGSRIAGVAGDQFDPRLCSDGAGGAYVVWIDGRDTASTGFDVWGHRLSGDGPVPTQVRGLTVGHRDGQTFLSWTCPAGMGWTYRIYLSGAPIAGTADLAQATLAGTVGDSSWCDRRLSGLLNTTYGYRLDSLAAPLGPTQAQLVRTVTAPATAWYAVTAQCGSLAEDRGVAPGVNATPGPIAESVGEPRPVWQRAIKYGYPTVDIYTLWVSRTDTPLFPAMSNREGQAFDCGIVRGGPPPDNAFIVRCHYKDASFLNVAAGTGSPGEWVLALDDIVPNHRDRMTFWYGFHPGYDLYSDFNVPPASGVVQDYTLRRILYTTLWARRTFPVDTFRTYSVGYSMGGIGTNMLIFTRPDLFAGAMSVISHFDFSFTADPDSDNSFNPGGGLRGVADREWGTVARGLPCDDGPPVYQRLNFGAMASAIEPQAVPPLIAMNGKRDVLVGWAEKIGFYRSMEKARQGGMFFWDMREHASPKAAWFPMQEARYLYRYRSDRSFPALSNCSADHDPGDGTATSGDSLGTINGFVEWDTSLVDVALEWAATLRLRDLTTAWGPMPGPESLTVDVTPRRLQNFRVVAGHPCRFGVTRLGDGALVQSGDVYADSLGRITVEGVKVYRSGSRLHLDYLALVDAGRPPLSRALTLALSRNPVAGRADLLLTWPAQGEGRVDLYDVSGRRVRELWRGAVAGGPARLALEAGALRGGIYFAVARAPGARRVQRVVVLR